MDMMARRRAMMVGNKPDPLPEQEIGYNLLLDVTRFKKQSTTYGGSEARWAGTDEPIPVNPTYTYAVGKENTRYYVHWFDAAKVFISQSNFGFWGGTATPPADARYAQVVCGITDRTIDEFIAAISSSLSFFRRRS